MYQNQTYHSASAYCAQTHNEFYIMLNNYFFKINFKCWSKILNLSKCSFLKFILNFKIE